MNVLDFDQEFLLCWHLSQTCRDERRLSALSQTNHFFFAGFELCLVWIVNMQAPSAMTVSFNIDTNVCYQTLFFMQTFKHDDIKKIS